MQVETYEVENSRNTEASAMAQDAEALELIEKLGLTGQASLTNPQTATRAPYRAMTNDEQIVYGALMTVHVKLENYSVDAIPLRVLQVAAHAKETELYDHLEVWHCEAASYVEDPILVGAVKDKNYAWMFSYHLLARWGRELLPFEQMEAAAVKILRADRLQKLRDIAEQVQARIRLVEQTNVLKSLSSEPAFNP